MVWLFREVFDAATEPVPGPGTLARPMDRTTFFASVGDANGDGIDDLATFDGLAGTQTLQFFWGEQR